MLAGDIFSDVMAFVVISATRIVFRGDMKTSKNFPHYWPFVRGIHQPLLMPVMVSFVLIMF